MEIECSEYCLLICLGSHVRELGVTLSKGKAYIYHPYVGTFVYLLYVKRGTSLMHGHRITWNSDDNGPFERGVLQIGTYTTLLGTITDSCVQAAPLFDSERLNTIECERLDARDSIRTRQRSPSPCACKLYEGRDWWPNIPGEPYLL